MKQPSGETFDHSRRRSPHPGFAEPERNLQQAAPVGFIGPPLEQEEAAK